MTGVVVTGAEFDSRRRALGLSISETAAFCAEVEATTVNRWINGRASVPPEALGKLDMLEEFMRMAVGRRVEITADETMSGPVRVHRYRTQEALSASDDAIGIPLGGHEMMTVWLVEKLAGLGITSEVVWANEDH